MKRYQPSRLACFLLLGLPLAAQESIVPFLPKDTLALVTMPDLAGSIERFSQMPLAKMWAEDEVQKFVADLREMGEKMLHQQLEQAKQMHAKGDLPVDPADLLALRVDSCTLALTSLHVTTGDSGTQPELGIAAHLHFGASAPTWNKLLDLGLGMLEQETGGMLEKSESKIGEVRTVSFRPAGGEGGNMGLHLAMVPNGLLITTLLPDLQVIVDGMQKKVPSLGAADDYAAIAKHLANASEKHESEVFVRPGSAIKAAYQAAAAVMDAQGIDMVDSHGVERALNAMGWFQLGASSRTSSYVDGKNITRSFEALAAGTKAQPGPIDLKFLKWIPKDAVGFSAGRMDATGIYDTLVKGLQAYDADLAKDMLGQLAEMEKQLGFSLRNDLLGAFGDHYISWQMPVSTFNAAPELAFLVKADEAKLVPALKGLSKLSAGVVAIEESEKRGIKTYELRINLNRIEQMKGMGNVMNQIQPTFAFKDGYMVAALSPNDIKRHFQRMDREDDPKGDIRSNKEFAGIAAQFPATVDAVSFTDWKSQFESFYQIVGGLLAFVRLGDEVPLDTNLLPEAATLTKHLFAMSSYTTSTADGTMTVTTSPFGDEIYAMFFAGMLTAVGVQNARRGF